MWKSLKKGRQITDQLENRRLHETEELATILNVTKDQVKQIQVNTGNKLIQVDDNYIKVQKVKDNSDRILQHIDGFTIKPLKDKIWGS